MVPQKIEWEDLKSPYFGSLIDALHETNIPISTLYNRFVNRNAACFRAAQVSKAMLEKLTSQGLNVEELKEEYELHGAEGIEVYLRVTSSYTFIKPNQGTAFMRRSKFYHDKSIAMKFRMCFAGELETKKDQQEENY